MLRGVDDDELRRRLVEAGHPAVARLRLAGSDRVHPGVMSSSSGEHAAAEWPHPASDVARVTGPYAPGAAYPDPMAASGPTAWRAGTDRGRVESPDGTTPWGQPDPPASVPPPVAGIDSPHTSPGWLTRGRDRL